MSRSRNIKPGFFTNELLVELPFEFRLLFVGMWTLADREGRLEDRPTKIKMALFPADSVDVGAGLQALHEAGFVLRYEADGRRLIQVLAWAKHQNPHFREAQSTLPAPVLSPIHDKKASGSNKTDGDKSQGKPETSPESKGGVARLIPDSGFLIPDSSSLCSEGAARKPALPPAITLPMHAGPDFPITAAQAQEFAELYPAVDVMEELRKMRGWLIGNPKHRKTKSGVMRFVTTWLAKAQDQGPKNRGHVNGHKPSAAASFHNKTYTGTLLEDLPEDLRPKSEAM